MFGKKNTYRIGGDEFVVFVKDESLEIIEKELSQINNDLLEQGYHVSFGIGRQDVPVEMDHLIKQAEVHMYEEKRRYYQQTGKDRRQRS